ncbi:hypothetical protein BV25DRAFT_1206220 [Artomyces pyxidatus]|uniref:Uncharacterized protein n=1 Tax=Artomyces pyxidatus TaxID=48021 RepID=A0ACB8SS97_9AGAM|nr:hypothetical protein BV25DRAFT_1206220 [Artomyces pyxidatus]
MVHHSRISILPDADIQAPMLPPVAPGIAFTNPFQTVQEEEKSPTLKASGKPIQSSRSVDDMLSFDQAQTITAYLNAVKRIGFGTYLPKATSKPTITSTNTVKYPAVKRKPPPPYAPSLADPVVLPPPLYPAAAVSDRERQWRSVLPSSVDSPPCRMPKVVPASHMSYKTAPCRHWTKNNGWCPLGDRCGFIHDDNLKWIPAQATGPGEPTSSSASSNDSEDGEIRYPTRKYKTSHCWATLRLTSHTPHALRGQLAFVELAALLNTRPPGRRDKSKMPRQALASSCKNTTALCIMCHTCACRDPRPSMVWFITLCLSQYLPQALCKATALLSPVRRLSPTRTQAFFQSHPPNRLRIL